MLWKIEKENRMEEKRTWVQEVLIFDNSSQFPITIYTYMYPKQ